MIHTEGTRKPMIPPITNISSAAPNIQQNIIAPAKADANDSISINKTNTEVFIFSYFLARTNASSPYFVLMYGWNDIAAPALKETDGLSSRTECP